VKRAPSSDFRRLRSNLRLVAILQACHDAGLTSVPLPVIHTIAYFTDALAPIWNIPLIEGQVLKKRRIPANPELQAEIDRLVGQAVILASRVRHVYSDGTWSLDAEYSLNRVFGDRIIAAISGDNVSLRELHFVREVVLALAGLGVPGISMAAQADASYSDPNIDFGEMIDFLGSGKLTRTTQVAKRFNELLDDDRGLSEAEITHLYVRHLYSSLRGQSV
jgi:hypothetical protein